MSGKISIIHHRFWTHSMSSNMKLVWGETKRGKSSIPSTARLTSCKKVPLVLQFKIQLHQIVSHNMARSNLSRKVILFARSNQIKVVETLWKMILVTSMHPKEGAESTINPVISNLIKILDTFLWTQVLHEAKIKVSHLREFRGQLCVMAVGT